MTHEEMVYTFAKGFLVATLASLFRWLWSLYNGEKVDPKK
jgi:hypothetical protein